MFGFEYARGILDIVAKQCGHFAVSTRELFHFQQTCNEHKALCR